VSRTSSGIASKSFLADATQNKGFIFYHADYIHMGIIMQVGFGEGAFLRRCAKDSHNPQQTKSPAFK
jgi:hypothetical protein